MKKILLVTACFACYMVSAQAQRPSKGQTPAPAAKADSTASMGPRSGPMPMMAKPGPRPFKEIITSKAVTSKGMFTVHKQDDKYFLEIADSILGRDILIVSRISKAAAGTRAARGTMGYAGDQINETVVRFEKGPNNKVFLKTISFQEFSKDSSENGLFRNVLNSNIQPIAAAFDIKAFNYGKSSKDSTDNKNGKKDSSLVIDFTDFCNGDNDILFFDGAIKGMLRISGAQPDKSYIVDIRTFPMNVEIKTVKTYGVMGGGGPGGPSGPPTPATYELNTSMVLLPAVPMKPRYVDSRVGYFTTSYIDFDKNPQGVEKMEMITRWRLEPKDEDIEKYKRGELVEPKKQIVYYIDPTTPKKWIPYLKAGVNDWQKAFEKAGFKNAVVAKEAPVGDSSWSLDDARHNAIVYKPSSMANARGPHVHDPRSGEIIETHIDWYHNVMSLLRNWYIIQAAAIDPRARKMTFDDELMGDLIRFVSSHEVGHTLGLRHNYGASSTIPVEMLRNKQWLKEHGHTPSIMDYARFNYVAQPEDGIQPTEGIYPRIGEYDNWAIQWGYKWMPDFKSDKEEATYLNKWIIDSLNSNSRLWFGTETDPLDPRCQNEDLGDNAMKAGAYGIKNLKRVAALLPEITRQDNEGYDNYRTMCREVLNQYGRYMGHVCKNIAGIKTTPKSVEQSGPVYEVVPKATQKEAMAFLQENLFTTPEWLTDKNIYKQVGNDPLTVISSLQEAQLERIFNSALGYGLLKFEALYGADAYPLTEMWDDLKKGIWSELKTHKKIDIYRKSLQRSYIQKLSWMITGPTSNSQSSVLVTSNSAMSARYNELPGLAKAHGKTLLAEIKAAVPLTSDVRSKAHLQDMADRITAALKATEKPNND